MAEYGLLPAGFSPKTFEVLRNTTNAAIQAAFSASIGLTDKDLLGFFVGIVCKMISDLWELAEAIVASQDPDQATGAALDTLAALTGTIRADADPSEVTLTLTGTPTTLVGVGSKAETLSTGSEFETIEDATIAAVDAYVGLTAYVLDDLVTNASRVYLCITAGTSGSGGSAPSSTSQDITDGTVHWRYMGEGTGIVDVVAHSVEEGPTVGAALDISVITTPVAGWSSVVNSSDATLGREIATDGELRIQREADLAALGGGTADAIRSALLQLDGVVAVTVFVNNTDTTDGDGVPPHAIEALVQGGTDQDIWNALAANVAAGIATYGDEDGIVEDSEGTEHTLYFSRPEEILIYIDIFVTKDPDVYPADGNDQIEEAVVDWGTARSIGDNVVASAISARAFQIDGVLDVTTVHISQPPTTDPVASTTIVITNRQLARFATTRITVTAVNGTP